MKGKVRSIKRTSTTGKYSRETVRTLVKAIHVLETEPEGWEVRTLGTKGISKRFEAKDPAIEYAFQVKGNGKVIIHQRAPKKVTVASVRRTGNRLTIKETEFR